MSDVRFDFGGDRSSAAMLIIPVVLFVFAARVWCFLRRGVAGTCCFIFCAYVRLARRCRTGVLSLAGIVRRRGVVRSNGEICVLTHSGDWVHIRCAY